MTLRRALVISLLVHLGATAAAFWTQDRRSIPLLPGESFRLQLSSTVAGVQSTHSSQASSRSSGAHSRELSDQLLNIEYPEVARRMGLEGEALVELQIDEAGSVANVQLLQSSGAPMLDRAALAGVRQWRFSSGHAETLRTPIRFRLTGPP
ncbi:MAG: energy transducer TonB [Leptospirales bacterium]|nr:energy transducer TonB [Leptospirales bacterium]